MYNLIVSSYLAESGLGVSPDDIYVNAMRKHFGCKTRWVKKDGKKLMEVYHPDGEAFPLKGAYFHHVENRFHRRAVKEARIGPSRARSEIRPFLGTFTESTWNLMQRVEADGYRCYQLPKGYIEGSDLPPLIVVTKRDTASGKKTGIGFSQGSETGAAYRMATFCEAVGLDEFCRLFGIKVALGSGHSKGVSPADITDRGPGATAPGLARDASLLPVVRETTPAHSGQSKAIAETSNPKTPSNDEAPSFERSNLNVIQLARREIFNLLKFNEMTNVASRIAPDIADIVTRQSPNGVWEALDSLGRNDAVDASKEEAVRSYLEPVPAVLRRGGVELVGRNYYSKSPEFVAALESAAGGDIPVRVYVLTACVRHVWFEWKERLIELDVRYPVPVANAVLYMSLEEAREYYEHTKKRDQRFGKHQQAVKQAVADDYEEQTGLKWGAGKRVAGRPKRGGAIARQEAAEAARSAMGKKAA